MMRYSVKLLKVYTVRRETLAPGKFGEWLRIRQIFPQLCGSWEFPTSRSQISSSPTYGSDQMAWYS